MEKLAFYRKVLGKAFSAFFTKNLLTQSAALSFYTIFSLPPMVLIILQVASRFYYDDAVKSAIFGEIGALVGQEGASQLMDTINKLHIFEPTWWATSVGIGMLLFTATTVFVTIQYTLNQIFEVAPVDTKALGLLKMLRDRILSLALLVSFGFILLVSLLVNTMLTALGNHLQEWIGNISTILVLLTSTALPLLVITLLFGMLFRFLPDARMGWKDVWTGAFSTALLFEGGKYLIGFYIGNSKLASLYDAAGSMIVVLLWVYYAAAIFLFGATFTFVRAKALNRRVQPTDYAVKVKKVKVVPDVDAEFEST